jgi:hypothetical protein
LIPASDVRDRLSRFVQVFDDALPPAVCARLVQGFEAMTDRQVANGRHRRSWLADSAWTELDITPLCDAGFRESLLGGIHLYLARYNERLGLTIPVPATSRTSEWIVKRYRAGGDERFQPHFDAVGPVANRYLVLLWYLNDVAEGGETAFVDLDLAITPKAGRLVIFPPYWMFQHEGRAPRRGDKYILSTYLLF